MKATLSDKLIIDMSTVLPETMISLGNDVIKAGGQFVECPVGGTVGPARDGKLFGLAGGKPDAVARARPLLEQLCRRIEHVGDLGAGATVKLAVNLPLLVYLQALGESLALCQSLKLPAAQLIDIMSDTPATPPVMKMRGPDILRLLTGGEAAATQFSVVGGTEGFAHRRQLCGDAGHRTSGRGERRSLIWHRRNRRPRRQRRDQHDPCPLGTEKNKAYLVTSAACHRMKI